MHTSVFTIISPNYRHFARLLMASVERQHPEWDRFVLMVGDAPAETESFESVPLDALPLPNRRQFCFRYTILELNTAVKPWMFEHLFARGYERVVYLDPDILLYSPLAELDDAPAETFLTLTPHLTGSIPGDDHPSERSILQAGTYNLGFLAVNRQPSLDRFLAWWQAKLEYQCVSDVERGLFVDQKWMDLTPGLFPGVRILRHEGYNVAYWNLRQRTVTIANGATTVNGDPLRFFHFSGVDPNGGAWVSRHDGRLTLADVGDARKLIEDYRAAMRTVGLASSRNAPYSLGFFTDGSRVPDAARFAYRNSPELQASAGDDPFAHPELFRTMHDHSRSLLAAKVALRAYRFFSKARVVVRLFPKPLRTRLREFLLGRRETAPQQRGRSNTLSPGVNVVGYTSRDTGVGESARLCQRSCEAAGIDSILIDVESNDSLALQPAHRASVYHVNADQTLAVHARIPDLFAASSYNIGVWHWELPELPDAWISAAAVLDEIWAPSLFVQSTISRKLTIPIVHMPHGVEVRELEPFPPQELGVPAGRFTFLTMFDLASVMERKNPGGAIDAFRRAFPNGDSAALLIKAGRADQYPREYAQLQEQLRGVPNVYLTDRMLSRARVNGLVAACDAVVSLHRSEGFGLVLAEAMDLGKPCVATGWSGNMDFMTASNSCPVGYELVTLDRRHDHYEAGQQWAEPDVEHAAHLMRRLADDASWRTQLGDRARHTIRTRFSHAAAGERYHRRLAFLGLTQTAG